MRQITALFTLIALLLVACSGAQTPSSETTEQTVSTDTSVSQATETPTPKLTDTPTPSVTPSPTSTPTPTPTDTPTPSPTPTPQVLGRVFPDEFHDQAVWTHAGCGGTDWGDGWRDRGGDFTLHFDVSLPSRFTLGDHLLSPTDGIVDEIYSIGDEGQVVRVKVNPRIAGVENLVHNQELLDLYAKGIYSFDYEPGDIVSTAFHFGHIIPLVNEGEQVKKGQPIAEIFFDTPFQPPVLAYVIYLYMRDGNYYQFSPCEVPNTAEFCGKCIPGTPYNCP